MKYLSLLPFFAVLLLAGVLSTGCKNTSTNPQGSAPGTITGFVQVYDTLYKPMPDNSGISVTLEGTSFKTISDASGKWTLANVPAGIYTLAFSKDHYITKKDQNTQFAGNGTLYYNLGGNITSMIPIPNLFPNLVLRPFEDLTQITEIKDSSFIDSSGQPHYVRIFDTVITKSEIAILSSRSQNIYQGQTVSSMIFFSNANNIDPSIPSSYLYSLVSGSYGDTSGISNFTVYRSSLLKSGFTSGSNIYCAAYAFTYLSYWYDPVTYKEAYSGFSPHHSEVRSFVLP